MPPRLVVSLLKKQTKLKKKFGKNKTKKESDFGFKCFQTAAPQVHAPQKGATAVIDKPRFPALVPGPKEAKASGIQEFVSLNHTSITSFAAQIST